MLRSMYSGISGMRVNQTKLDVIGNNISNVGTTAFKGSRVTFNDMLSQNVKSAMAPSANQGGVNSSQVGLGVQISSIDRVMTQGMMQPTNRALDLALDGEGFFMVSKGPVLNADGAIEVSHRQGNHSITAQSLENSNSELMYTRDGSFILDAEGNLLTGDGFRVLGYSVTNDDSSQSATAKESNAVSTAGLDFRFGPGSQLNGYKVVLGEVGPGTVTSADVKKADKTIILNADFSRPGALTTAQIESALNKGLSSAGISQSIYVSGKPATIPELSSENILGGADATSPNSVSIGGFTFQFTEGSELNGYSFEINKVGTGTPLDVRVNTTSKKIIIDGDFITKGAVSGVALKESINAALSGSGFTQTINNFSGTPVNIPNVSGAADTSGTDLTGLTLGVNVSSTATSNTFGGLTLNFEDGGQLNGYTVKFGDTTTGAAKVVLNKTDKTIVLSGNLTDPTVVGNLVTAFNNELSRTGITTNKLTSITGTFDAGDATNTLSLSGGSDLKAPKSVEIAGGTINLPKGMAFNGVKFEIVDAMAPSLSVNFDAASNTFKISGDFATPNAVTSAALMQQLNSAADDAGIFGTIGPNNQITVTGNIRTISGLNSGIIDGGVDLKTPGTAEFGGMQVDFTPGGELNGYTIQIGNISAGTATSASIDATNKKIIVNADLVTGGVVTGVAIQNAINQMLQDKGFNQSVVISGEPNQISGTESNTTEGGTPVQSIDNNGVINFVDATGEVKAYDENLKTLKIPEKIKIPGTNTELRVKTFSIDKNGVINGVLEDGRVAALGQVATASFKNPEGLTSLGGNLYGQSVNSGDAVIKSGVGTLGDDNSKGYGDMLQGFLEMSNVDLAEQFTDMIVTSRAFQAAGKMITTGDEVLQDIIALKR